jgi:hypothetical protein
MNAGGLLAAAVTLVAAMAAMLMVTPAVRRTGLGIVHPSVAWLALHVVFFGFGAVVLAATGSIGPGAALYTGAAALAVAGGTALSDRFARGRAAMRGAGRPAQDLPVRPGTADPASVRTPVVAAAIGIAIGLLAPDLVATGLPLLSGDPTGARTELAGILVHPLRIALPAASAVTLVAILRRPSRGRVAAATAGIGAGLLFTVLLASRYLAAEVAAALVVAWLLAGRRLDPRAVAGVALAALVVFAGVQVLRAPEEAAGREIAFATERTVSRVLLVQPRTLDALMDAIPSDTPHFNGLTWLRRVAPLVGRDDVPNLGYWIYPRLFPDQEPGVQGYAAPGLIGEAWANFGILGLGLFAILGVALERLGALIAGRREGTADLAAAAALVVVLARTHALGLNGALVLVALAVAWRVLAGRGLRGLARALATTMRWRD